MKKIFLIEDDYALAQAVKKQIESWGNEVVTARDFRNIMEEFVACDPQLVLVDVMLPFFNGYHWCTEIRKVSNVPIVFLSSASDNMNIVMAMNLGADDFIPKPVDPMVLTAKVSAILRRAYDLGEVQQELEHRGLRLNLGDNSVTVAEGTAVSLKFGDEDARYADLLTAGAFDSVTSEKVFEDKNKGLLA